MHGPYNAANHGVHVRQHSIMVPLLVILLVPILVSKFQWSFHWPVHMGQSQVHEEWI